MSTAKDLLEQCPAALGPVEEALGKELLMDLVRRRGGGAWRTTRGAAVFPCARPC